MSFREALNDLAGPQTLVFVTTVDPATTDVMTKVYHPSPFTLGYILAALGEPVAEALADADVIDSIRVGKPGIMVDGETHG